MSVFKCTNVYVCSNCGRRNYIYGPLEEQESRVEDCMRCGMTSEMKVVWPKDWEPYDLLYAEWLEKEDNPFGVNYKKEANRRSKVTDFETWLHDYGDRIYRYWIYKRMFTPNEQAKQYVDQSLYEDDHCCYGVIKEAIELPDGDILLGFVDPYTEENSIAYGYIDYHKLSEIALVYCPYDAEEEDG